MAIKIKRGAFEVCTAKVAEAAEVDNDTAFNIIKQVVAYGDQLRKQGIKNPFDMAATELAEREKQQALLTRIDSLNNTLVRKSLLNKVAAGDVNGGKNAWKTLTSVIRRDPTAPTNDNIESRRAALSHSWQAVVGHALEKDNLTHYAISGELDKEVSEAWWRINGGDPNEDIKVSKPAQRMAEIYSKSMNLAKDSMNNEGARIGDATDYVTHTNWDSGKLLNAAGKYSGGDTDKAFEAWWAKDGPRMADKTFDHVVPNDGETTEEARKRFGRSVFDATASGVHKKAITNSGLYDDGDSGYIPPSFEGTRNVARAASKQRVIYWKDAGSWNDHMKDFGEWPSLYAQVNSSLDGAARRTALMHGLGTNPQGNLNQVIDTIRKQYRSDPVALKAFDVGATKLKLELSYLDGSANIPHNEDWADYQRYALQLESAAHLGGVGITHLTAAPMTVSAELAHHGISHLDGIGKLLGALVRDKGPEERQQVLAEAGAYARGYNMQLASKLQAGGGAPGAVAWASTNFIKATGLPWLLNRLQANGVKSTLMTHLGANTEKAFGDLNSNLAQALKRYNIGSEEWDLLRSTPSDLTIEGQKYLTPKHASDIDSAKASDLLKQRGVIGPNFTQDMVDRETNRFKSDLGTRYLMYLNDAADSAVVTPGVREQRIAIDGARPGSTEWFVRKSVSQFKMWPVAAVQQLISKNIAQSLGAKQMAANFGWLIALTTAGGTLRGSINDAVAGRPQKNYLQPQNLMTAVAQGGGLGIWGDMIFGEIGRASQSQTLASAFGGPIGSDTEKLYQMYAKFRDEASSPDPTKQAKSLTDAEAPLLRFGVQHIPFANLVYIKGALNYLAFYHMYEAASPGWWERTNQQMIKEGQPPMMGYSPGSGVPFNPLSNGTNNQ